MFREKWLKAVKEKDSVLCAGLDPAEYEMGRGPKGLPEGTNKAEWAKDYVRNVAPYCAAVKPNFQYWKGEGDVETLKEISKLAHELGMVVIDDSKLADIGSTNEAGVYYAAKRGADAVTYSPFAGNIQEVGEQGEKLGVGIISMCLMSNPQYEAEKNKLVSADLEEEYKTRNIIMVDSAPHVKQYVKLAHDANKYGIEGIVIGAPSKKNHIMEQEIETINEYVGENMLVLLPGVGAQGGEAEKIWEYFGPDNVIVNVGRSLMFPKDLTHEETAKNYRSMLNELRNKKA